MKRKINILSGIFVLICLITTNANAQGFFMKFNAGYNFPFGDYESEYINMTNLIHTHTATSIIREFENVKFSLGKGIDLNLSPGYMLNKNLGAELGISYLIGLKTESTRIEYSINGTQYKDINICKGSLISFTPSIIIAAGLKKLDPYSKFGVIIGIPSFTHEYNSNYSGDIFKFINKYSGSMAIGVIGTLGVRYPLTEKFGAFLELAMNSLNYTPSKSVETQYIVNGIDQLPSLTTYQKETEYVDPYTYDASATPDQNKPAKELKITYPFSSLAINLGVCMRF